MNILRPLIAAACLAWFAGAAPAQDKKVTVRWFGQSFFQIVTSAGTRIVLDPHAIEQYPRNVVPADLVLISHPHVDHSTLTPVENRDKAKVLAGVTGTARRQEWNLIGEKFRDVQITSVGLYHDKDSGMSRGRNSALVLEFDGLRFCHLGDLGHELNERQLRAIGEIDVLMIPVGGIYTLNGTDAKKVMAQIKPKRYVLPMHYGTKAFEDLLPADEFLEGQKNVEKRLNTNELIVDPTAEKPEQPKIVILGWKKGAE